MFTAFSWTVSELELCKEAASKSIFSPDSLSINVNISSHTFSIPVNGEVECCPSKIPRLSLPHCDTRTHITGVSNWTYFITHWGTLDTLSDLECEVLVSECSRTLIETLLTVEKSFNTVDVRMCLCSPSLHLSPLTRSSSSSSSITTPQSSVTEVVAVVCFWSSFAISLWVNFYRLWLKCEISNFIEIKTLTILLK